jgi:hypothetical protein
MNVMVGRNALTAMIDPKLCWTLARARLAVPNHPQWIVRKMTDVAKTDKLQ